MALLKRISPILLLIIMFFFSGCSDNFSLVNTAHLDYLYQEVTISGTPAAIVYIYCAAPDYKKIGAKGEGIACVDDAARAAVFYLRHYQVTGSEASQQKARRLLNFTMLMQAENGFFYNFINENYQIDTVIVNSRPVPDWWSWRALWALSEAYRFYAPIDSSYSARLDTHISKMLASLNALPNLYPEKRHYGGFELPAWLPQETAADQAALLMIGLNHYYQACQDTSAALLIKDLGRGIMQMQAGDSSIFPYGAFLSWRSEWHAWGNSQSEALFQAGKSIDEPGFIKAALRETTHFFSYLIKENYLNWFRLQRQEGVIIAADKKQYEQIAYGIRPMVMASLAAYQITKKEKFAEQAAEIAGWLLGKNITSKLLYDPGNGRGYDGINSDQEINYNAGAESTIEALLTLLAVENNPISSQILHDYYPNQ